MSNDRIVLLLDALVKIATQTMSATEAADFARDTLLRDGWTDTKLFSAPIEHGASAE